MDKPTVVTTVDIPTITITLDQSTPLPSKKRSLFIHTPLQDHDKAIRLLRVLPDLRDGRIQIEMRNTKRTPGTYSCLSYQWGDCQNEQCIFVNGNSLDVRKNLYDFLNAARLRFQYSPLWIDALCINQHDDNEKGHQVRRMGQIYTDAAEVFVWLGNESGLDRLFDFSTPFYQQYIAQIQSTSARRAGLHRLSGGHPEEVITCFERLLTHAYWWRAWIAQEVLLAQRVYILNGTKWVDFNLLCHVAYSIRYLAHVQRGILYTSPAMEFWERKQKGEVTMRRAQVFAFDWIWRAECYDARDRLYSILALLAPDSKRAPFEVDYTEDICSFFWRAGEYLRVWNGDWRLRKFFQSTGVTSAALSKDLRTRTTPPSLTVNARYAGMPVNRPSPDGTLDQRCALCRARIDTPVKPLDALLCSVDPWRSQHILLRGAGKLSPPTVAVQYRSVFGHSIASCWKELHETELWHLKEGAWVSIRQVPQQIFSPFPPSIGAKHHFCVRIPPSLAISNVSALEADIKLHQQGTYVADGILPPYDYSQVQAAKTSGRAREMVDARLPVVGGEQHHQRRQSGPV